MAELRIKRGSLLIQLWDRFLGSEECVFATMLYPLTKEHGKIDRITFHGWRPPVAEANPDGSYQVKVRPSSDGQGWTVQLEDVPEPAAREG